MSPTKANKQKISWKTQIIGSSQTLRKSVFRSWTRCLSIFAFGVLISSIIFFKMKVQVFPLMFGFLDCCGFASPYCCIFGSSTMHRCLPWMKMLHSQIMSWLLFFWQLLTILLWRGKELFQAFVAFGSYRWFFFAVPLCVITSHMPCHWAGN